MTDAKSNILANTASITPTSTPVSASDTPTIDFLIENLPQEEIVRLLKARDPNAVNLLRTMVTRPELTLIVTQNVIAELGLRVSDDETAIKVLHEIRAKIPNQGHEKLLAMVDRLLFFAQADLDTDIDLEGIDSPFELLEFLRGDTRLCLLCETTISHLLSTLLPE